MDKIDVVFRLLYKPEVPINAKSIVPSMIAGLALRDLKSILINVGNKKIKVEEIFDIDCYNVIDKDPKNISILFTGNGTEKLWFIGKDMDSGIIVIRGNVGPFAGYRMKGGCITIYGDAREWLGASMNGGVIEVHGNAKDFVGAKPFFSSYNGMTGGKIVIYGDAGSFVGSGMSGGYIEILGNAKDFIGLRMKGGIIVVHKSVGIYPALEMVNGLIVIGDAEAIAPGFYRIELGRNLEILEKRCARLDIYLGDGLLGGQGIIILLKGEELKQCCR